VIDGINRLKCLYWVIEHKLLAENGTIIYDDMHRRWLPHEKGPDYQDAWDALELEGFEFDTFVNFLNDNNFIINIYDEKNKGEYEMHTDGEDFDKNYTVKLTLLLNLSEKKYEGGKFSIFAHANLHEVKEFNEPGTLLMFPSYVPHKVSPVTKGQRISGTFFITGPWWK